MRTEDISGIPSLATTPPEEAAKNIYLAKEIDMQPDAFDEVKETLGPQILESKQPKQMPLSFTSEMKISRQHASVMKEDLTIFDRFSKWAEASMGVVRGRSVARDLYTSKFKELSGEPISDEEKFKQQDLEDRLGQLNELQKDYNVFEMAPAEIVATFTDAFEGLKEGDKGLLVAGATGGAIGGAAVVGTATGGVGVLPGAVGGAITGTSLAYVPFRFRDAYQISAGQVYADLQKSLNDPNNPNAESERRSIAKGAGLLMGSLDALPIGAALKKVPWVKQLMNTRGVANWLLRPENVGWRGFFSEISRSALFEGVTEGSQEAIQIVAEEMGTTWDGSETSFMEAFKNAASKWENVERVGKASATGAIVGAGATALGQGAQNVVSRALPDAVERDVTPTPAPQITGSETAVEVNPEFSPQAPIAPEGDLVADMQSTELGVQPTPDIEPVNDILGQEAKLPTNVKGTRALQLLVALRRGKEITADSRTKEFLPESYDKVIQGMYEDAGMGDIWVDPDELRAWANNEEKAEAARAILDPSGVAQSQLNSPIRMDAYKFLKLSEQFPDADMLAKSEPEGLSVNEYLAQLKRADQARQEFKQEVPERPEDTPLLDVTGRVRDEDITSQIEYLSQETYTKEIESVISPAEIMRYNEGQLKARVEIADAIRADEEMKFNKATDLENQIQTQILRDQEIARIESDENISTVEDYLNNEIIPGGNATLDGDQRSRGDRGWPVYSINPATLPDNLRARFVDDAILKRRHVFDKKGQSATEVAAIFGFQSVESFLDVLSKTPTKKQSLKNFDDRMKIESDEESRGITRGFDDSRISKAYDDITRIKLKELKVVLNKAYPAFKIGVKRAALGVPRIQELSAKAKDQVGQTQIKHLNTNQWKIAERKSRRAAVDAALKNKPEELFREVTTGAMTTQLAKETHIAIAKVNRANRFIAKLHTPRVQGLLKKAGPQYERAVNEMLGMFGFRESTQKDVDAYKKFADEMLKNGQGDYRIPNEVLDWLSTKESARSLTVDEFMYFTEKLENILQQARLKNKLVRDHLKKEDKFTVDYIAETLREEAVKHPDYDPKRLEIANQTGSQQMSMGQRVNEAIATHGNFMKNIKSIIDQLGNEDMNSIWSQMLWQPLNGTGLAEGPYGNNATIKLTGSVKSQMGKVIKAFGKKEYEKLGREIVDIPEFRNTKGLNGGKLSKLNLLVMALHTGNDYNLQQLTNYGITQEQIFTVINRELGTKAFDFAQGVWDIYANFKPRLAALEKATTGKDIEYTVQVPFEVGGKQYRGGHMSIKYLRDSSTEAVIKEQEDLFKQADPNNNDPTYVPNLALYGIVRSPHTKARQGSDLLIDLDIETLDQSLSEVIHDLTMRVPVRDTMKLLKDKTIRESAMAIIGHNRYRTLVDLVAKQTNSTSAGDIRLFRDQQKTMAKLFSTVDGAMSTIWIAGNLSSFLMSALSYNQVLRKMGVISGAKYIAMAGIKIVNNPGVFNQTRKWMVEAEPSMALWSKGLEEFSLTPLARDKPIQGMVARNDLGYAAKRLGNAASHALFNGVLGGADQAIKQNVFMAAYLQYLNGEAPGHAPGDLKKMTEQELDRNATAYATDLLNSTTMAARDIDKAPVQQILSLRQLSRFINEPRNAYNGTTGEIRRIKQSVRATINKAKSGDYDGAANSFMDAGARVSKQLFLSLATLFIINSARNALKDNEDEAFEDDTDSFDKLGNFLSSNKWGIFGEFTGLSSGVLSRDLLFSIESGRDSQLPWQSGFNAVKNTLSDTAPTAMQGLLEGMTLEEVKHELSDKQWKEFFTALSIGTRIPMPVNAYFKWRDWWNQGDDETSEPSDIGTGFSIREMQDYFRHMDKTYGVDETDEERFEREFNEAVEKDMERDPQSHPTADTMKVDAQLARETLAKMTPDLPKNPLTDDNLAVIAQAESGGKWNAESPAGAFGKYQFTKSTWRLVMNTDEGRALGLNEEDRFDPNPKYQDQAMDILTKYNTRSLKRKGIPANIETLYYSHHFGIAEAGDVYKVPDDTPLPEELRKGVILKVNPQLKNIKTAGDMKRYIRKVLDKGQRELTETSSL